MKLLSLIVFLCTPLAAQNISFLIDTSNGSLPSNSLQSLPSAYSFTSTPVGSVSSIVIRAVNTGSAAATLNAVFVGNAPNSAVANPNYTVTGLAIPSVIAPGSWKLFTLNFTPSTIGTLNGYLQYATTGTYSVATLAGVGTGAQLSLSCSSQTASQCTGATLQPSSTTPISFGNVLTTSSNSIQFTLVNAGTSTLNPQTIVSIQTTTNNPNSAFSLGFLPSILPGGTSITFSVTFAPGAATTYQTSLLVGSAAYLIQGSGIANSAGDLSSLVVTYVDSTGVRLTAQPGTSINFGQTVAGTNISSTLSFTVASPQTTIAAVTVPSISVSGAGFTASNLPTFPAVIQPGGSISFSVSFGVGATGSYTGALSIGTRQFALAGQTIAPLIPAASFTLDQATLSSQQQVHLTVQLASPSATSAIGTLSMSFTPSVQGIGDDPAVEFVANSSRQLSVNIAAGAQTATYNNQNTVTFQTGTTAGEITFTVQFPNSPAYSKTFAIPPVSTTLTSTQAVRQSPNLVVTLTGYDNTYSTSTLNFTFYDTSGKVLTATPISVNAASVFHNYFFSSSNTGGGAFSLQASFPVTGDVNQIGSVSVTMANSAGQSSTTQTFQ